ncbi:MAG: hypothetical protein PHX68_03880 [Alphaproteobacteria bacterium]|nr:hypothetical protein [Alphaproteobacteria bacterium]
MPIIGETNGFFPTLLWKFCVYVFFFLLAAFVFLDMSPKEVWERSCDNVPRVWSRSVQVWDNIGKTADTIKSTADKQFETQDQKYQQLDRQLEQQQ